DGVPDHRAGPDAASDPREGGSPSRGAGRSGLSAPRRRMGAGASPSLRRAGGRRKASGRRAGRRRSLRGRVPGAAPAGLRVRRGRRVVARRALSEIRGSRSFERRLLMSAIKIQVAMGGLLAKVSLSRAEKYNAFDREMLRELADIVRGVTDSAKCRVV